MPSVGLFPRRASLPVPGVVAVAPVASRRHDAPFQRPTILRRPEDPTLMASEGHVVITLSYTRHGGDLAATAVVVVAVTRGCRKKSSISASVIH